MTHYTTILLLLLITSIHAQVQNDNCLFATFIPNIDGYCSEPGEFTNEGAMPDPIFTDVCFLNYQNGVWFSFVPAEPAINIRVFGEEVGNNTLGFPKMALFAGCGNYINCSPGKSKSTDEFTISNLVAGQLYYLMVESNPEMEGTFQLCIDDFTPMPSPSSDCDDAIVLCNKAPFVVENLNSQGADPNEANGSCIGGEIASSWYVWECDQSGTLTMELTPANLGIEELVDDLDFIIFELPNGKEDCGNRIELRCMGSGANVTNGMIDPLITWASCNRATGMAVGETDFIETGGCRDSSNNYVAPLDMIAGKTYGMLINNFTNTGLGFSVEFGGTGSFVGPETDFEIEAATAFRCDETILFTDLSDTGVDPVVNYIWNFGSGANPSTATGSGPHSTIYDSFGAKSATLTLEGSSGCFVTKVVDFYIERCCQDTSTLGVDGITTDIPCFGNDNGEFLAQGYSGSPAYQYSLNGVNFQPNPQFLNLSAGQYELTIVDQRGCTASTNFEVDEPEELIISLEDDAIVISGGVEPYEIILDETVDEVRTIVVGDANGCVTSAEFMTTNTTDSEFNDQLKLYPIPAKDILNIDYGGLVRENSLIRIIDLQGQVKMYKSGSPKQLDVDELAPGLYLFQYFDENSLKSIFKKITIQ